ncbi:MAG: formate dehydrogenase subunit alpha [Methanotrichaceae archaeon]|nr:formate dehydrogenase subunit alpha [Methanotrichaceae archaeon]
MDEIAIIIDDRKIKVPKDTTILEAARKSGIYIPALCDHPDLEPIGACKLCIVSVDGWEIFPTACNTPVQNNMIVRTKTEEIQEMRRHALEMLLAITNHPVSCLFCERKTECEDFRECMHKMPVTVGCKYCHKNDECELQTAVEFVELRKLRYPTTFRNMPVLKEPFFDRDYNLCILCTRCVRTCMEVRGEGILSIYSDLHRNHWIGPECLMDADCKFCGACVDVCPTGALIARFEKWLKPISSTLTLCPYCGVGCQLEIGVLDNSIVRVRGARGASPNNGQLCVKGRFGLEFVESPERLKTPLIRKNGQFEPASWEEALNTVVEQLSNCKGNSFGFLSSAKCTNEENYLAQKFARLVMETNNIDHCARLCHASTVSGLAMAFGSGAMTNSIEELKDAGCIFIIGSNTTEQHPVISLKIKEAKKRGAKIIIANPRWIGLCKIADIWLRHVPGTDVALIQGMCHLILEENLMDHVFITERTEGFDEFMASLQNFSLSESSRLTGVEKELIEQAARIYARGNPSSIVYSMGITQHSHGVDNVLALANLAMMTGNIGKRSSGINPLRGQNNVQGSCDMGALPNVLTGYQAVADSSLRAKFEKAWGKGLPEQPGITVVEMMASAEQGKIRAMYIMGENPVLSNPDSSHVITALKTLDFLVVQDIFLTETAKMADVVLPATTSLEKDGTFTNTERKVQRVVKTLDPIGLSWPDWKIISELGKRMGEETQFSYSCPEEIMNEAAMLTSSYGGISYSRLINGGLQWPCPSLDHPGTNYLHKEKFSRGKGRFHALSYRPSAELPDKDFPLILTTGRILCQYHTGTMTRKVSDLNLLRGEERVEVNPFDAKSLGIEDGELVDISSRRGRVRAKAKVTEKSPRGVVFMTFHFFESPTNVLTNAALDPIAKIPELKVCAIRLDKVRD